MFVIFRGIVHVMQFIAMLNQMALPSPLLKHSNSTISYLCLIDFQMHVFEQQFVSQNLHLFISNRCINLEQMSIGQVTSVHKESKVCLYYEK